MTNFARLPSSDQSILLKGSVLEMFFLRSALTFDSTCKQWPNVNMAAYCNAPTLKLDDVSHLTSSKLLQMHMDFVASIQQMGVDEPTIMLLALIALYTPEKAGLECAEWIEHCQLHYTSLLEHYMAWRFGPIKSRGMFGKILSKLADLRELADTHNHNNLQLGRKNNAILNWCDIIWKFLFLMQVRAAMYHPYRNKWRNASSILVKMKWMSSVLNLLIVPDLPNFVCRLGILQPRA